MLRTTLTGFAIGAVAFALLGVYLNVSVGAPAINNLGPVGVFALIGGTIGGLLSPMFANVWRRRG